MEGRVSDITDIQNAGIESNIQKEIIEMFIGLISHPPKEKEKRRKKVSDRRMNCNLEKATDVWDKQNLEMKNEIA